MVAPSRNALRGGRSSARDIRNKIVGVSTRSPWSIHCLSRFLDPEYRSPGSCLHCHIGARARLVPRTVLPLESFNIAGHELLGY